MAARFPSQTAIAPQRRSALHAAIQWLLNAEDPTPRLLKRLRRLVPRLLSTIIAFNFLHGILVAYSNAVVSTTKLSVLYLIFGIIALCCLGYLLNRWGYIHLSALLPMMTLAAGPWLSYALMGNDPYATVLVQGSTLISVLFSGILLYVRLTALLGGAHLLGMSLSLVALPRELHELQWALMLLMVFLFGLIVLASAYYRRDLLELETQTRSLWLKSEEVRVSQERSRILFNHSPLPAWVVESSTLRILEVNDAAIRQYGYSRPEFLALSLEDLYPTPPTASPPTSAEATGLSEHRKKDGSRLLIEITTQNFVSDGQTRQLMIAKDISEPLRSAQALRHREKQLAQAQQIAHVGSWEIDLRSGQLNGSDEMFRILGLERQTFPGDVGFVLDKLVHPYDRQHLAEAIEAARKGEVIPSEFRVIRPNGVVRSVYVEGEPVTNTQGEVIQAVGVIRDITEQKQAHQDLLDKTLQLEKSMSQLTLHHQQMSLLHQLSELLQACQIAAEAYQLISPIGSQLFPDEVGCLYILDAQGQHLEMVCAWGETSAMPSLFAPNHCWALRRGKPCIAQSSEPHAPIVTDVLSLVCQHVTLAVGVSTLCVPLIAHGNALGVLHLRYVAPPSPLDDTPQPISSHWNKPQLRLAQTIADSIALALANLDLLAILQQQSLRDPLTSLYNRRYLEEALERELHRAKREGHSVSVILLDIDHFKRFNDTFGHEAGDMVLQAIAQLLQSLSRASDIACRLGGEEFVLAMPEGTLEVTAQRAEALRLAAAQIHLQYLNQPLDSISLSCGVAAYPQHAQTLAGLLRAADAALYEAKNAGRNRVVLAAI